MVSPNDDDLMSQVFASVQLPEVKWNSESHENHEVIRKTVTVNENGEQHVHTEHYHYNNHNGDEHESEDEHHHVEHSDNHGYHGKADEELVSQVFFNRPTVETFRVENGIPESDDASERSSSRMSHHSHHSHHSNHSRHMSESDRNHGHHILAREQELENGHLSKKVLENVPHKSQQQDSMIAELKKHQSGHDDSSSDDGTLKGDDDDHTVGGRHEEMWHHEPHEEEHIVHYEMPPHEPPRDYESHRSSIAHSDHNVQQKKVEQTNYFNSYNHDNRSQRSNSVHSEASHHSYQVPPSHHSSHDSIPNYQPPPPPQQQPATRDSRASSTSTLRSDRNIRIVTNHTPPAPPPQPTYDNGYDADEPAHRGEPKGIHTVREYGTHGHRRSNASEVSSVDYNRESFTVGDIEYIQEKPKARERTSKQSSMNSNQKPPHLSHHQHYDNHQEQRYRTDTKQSSISQHHETSKPAHHFNPVKRQSYTPRGVVGHFVPSVDDSPIAPVSHLADQYGGRSHANKSLFFPHKHEEAVEQQHHSRASSKRGSDASSVHSLKHVGNKNERSNTQHSILSQASIGHGVHKRRASTDSVGTQHTAIVDKNPGKYDSVRVVKNVRSYKEFLDVWSQREIEEATEEGPIPHVEPIPRPRYSISARHVYPDSLKIVQEPKHRASLRSAALRPSEHLNEHSAPGKVDKATSYHNLHLIGDEKSRHSTFIGGEDKSRRSTLLVGSGEDKSRKSTFIGEQKSRHSTFVPIQEEEEVTEVHHHHHYHINGGTENIPKSRKSTLKQIDIEHENDNHHHHHHHDHNDDDEYEVDIHHLRSVFETDNERIKSRRASVQSTASGKSFARIPIVPASHRQPSDNGLLYSRRRR
jgi:hypothetical protein